jgi:hypothetical protein
MAIRKLPLLVASLAVVLLGGADDPAKGQKQKDKDPQATYEPRSRPGVGQKFLEKFVGDWDVQKSFFPRSGEPFRVNGECKQEMTHEGRFLKSEFTFGTGAAKTTGTGTIGFEADSGKFTSVWVDSRATRMSFRQSADKFNGEEIVLLGKSLGEGGETRRSRTMTRLEDEGRKIVHRQYSIDAEGKERLVMELVLTRKTTKP